MTPIEKRVERQRTLVAGLRQRLAFERLVLERLERRAPGDMGASEERSLASILKDARRRSSTNGS